MSNDSQAFLRLELIDRDVQRLKPPEITSELMSLQRVALSVEEEVIHVESCLSSFPN